MLYRLEAWIAKNVSAVAARVKKVFENVESHAHVRMVLFFALLALIAGVMLLLNIHTPLMMDDYDYSFSWATGERIASVIDVIPSQAAHYTMWGGRSVVHALAQAFLSVDKLAFSAANTLMYLLLLLEIYELARPRNRSWCWELLLIAHAVLFTLVPFFGTVFLWLTGACNYLWGTALALTPLMLAKKASERDGFVCSWKSVPAVTICFLAGWTNENTACGVLTMMVVWLAARTLHKEKVHAWQWAALIAQAAGTAVMLLAPGNFSRASSYESGNMLIELLRRAASATVYGGVYVGALIIAMLMLGALCGALHVKCRNRLVMLYVFGGLGAAYSMIASPVFSDRSWTGVIVLALCALLILVGDLVEQVRAFDAAKLLVLPLAVLLLTYGGYKALGDVKAHEEAWSAQVAMAEEAARSGCDSVVLSSVKSVSRFTMDIKLAEEADVWPNSTLSKAFGIIVNGE